MQHADFVVRGIVLEPQGSDTLQTEYPPQTTQEHAQKGKVVAQVGDDIRVVACRDDVQWIVQVWYGGKWRSRHFCRQRDTLLRLCGDHAALRALPPWYPDPLCTR